MRALRRMWRDFRWLANTSCSVFVGPIEVNGWVARFIWAWRYRNVKPSSCLCPHPCRDCTVNMPQDNRDWYEFDVGGES